MIHEMGVDAVYFNFIKDGTKRVELRLYDEKRAKIELGDEVIFMKEPDRVERISGKVVGLYRAKSFETLIEDLGMELVADKSISKEELMNVIRTFYSAEQEALNGVLGIRVELD